jgi:hypothetical protein
VARRGSYAYWYPFHCLHICLLFLKRCFFTHPSFKDVCSVHVTYWIALPGEGQGGQEDAEEGSLSCQRSSKGETSNCAQTSRLSEVSGPSILFLLVASTCRAFCPIYFHICQRRYYGSMREIVHLQAGQCGNQIGAKVSVGTVQMLLIQPVRE